MLKDRIPLLEQEIAKQKKLCSGMYLQSTVYGELGELYDLELDKLYELQSDLDTIKATIHEYDYE